MHAHSSSSVGLYFHCLITVHLGYISYSSRFLLVRCQLRTVPKLKRRGVHQSTVYIRAVFLSTNPVYRTSESLLIGLLSRCDILQNVPHRLDRRLWVCFIRSVLTVATCLCIFRRQLARAFHEGTSTPLLATCNSEMLYSHALWMSTAVNGLQKLTA